MARSQEQFDDEFDDVIRGSYTLADRFELYKDAQAMDDVREDRLRRWQDKGEEADFKFPEPPECSQ